MKFRILEREPERIDAQMAPMIDVVFLLLIFFLLTLRFVEPEGDFDVNMPIGAATPAKNDELNLPEFKVRLIANADGSLKQLRAGQVNLGNGDDAFQRLNQKVLKFIGGPGNPVSKDLEVEIDADYMLNFAYIIQAVGACTGSMANGKMVRYIEKIKFAPPRSPAGK